MDATTQLQTSKIGYYHYNMFHSAYGSPQLLGSYKLEFVWVFLEIIFVTLALTFEPYPTFNGVVDKLTSDPRAAFTYYWFPTFFYMVLSVFSISDYLDKWKRNFTAFVGVLCLLWHMIYFLIFWVSPSVRLPQYLREMSVSAGWYWTELFLNLILIFIQIIGTKRGQQYLPYRDERLAKVKQDINRFLNVETVQPDEKILLNPDQNEDEHNDAPQQEPPGDNEERQPIDQGEDQ